MAWQTLASRINGLPLVLCGPIVRRVEANAVSVWVALKAAATVELRLFATENSPTPLFTGSAMTRSFGEHLHVALVTVSTDGSGTELAAGGTYFYDLGFGAGRTLESAGVLGSGAGGLSKIVYPGHARPSFVVPPTDVGELTLAQASCRKVHGGDTDGMAALDAVLESRIATGDRPQQLFLTGDQIYADDVADVVLHQAIDAATVLLGWPNLEPLPGDPSEDELRVGSRTKLLEDEGFTGETICHLIRLGEFYAMYLMGWSVELWDAELPSYDTVLPHKSRTVSFQVPFDSSTIEFDSDDFVRYREQHPKVLRFKEKLPATRRLLANIATYTALDDHEVTDDWFLDAAWTEDVLKDGNVTRRVIQNALSAYVLFQAWGNTPSRYETGAPATLLTKLEAVHAAQGAGNAWQEIADLLVPEFVEVGGDIDRVVPKIRLDYRIDFPAHRLICLDTRSARGFPERDFVLWRLIKRLLQLIVGGVWLSGAELISNEDFPNQLPDDAANRQLVAGQALNLVISPAPIFGHPFVEEIVRPRIGAVARYFVDYEDWSLNRDAFQEVLRRLSLYSPVVVLAGDVHYSLSAVMKYWDERLGSPQTGVIVQLCCSAARNSDLKTNFVDGRLLNPDDRAEYLAWTSAGDHVRDGLAGDDPLVHVAAAPKVHRLKEAQTLVDPESPAWRYRVEFASDQRTTDRGVPPPASGSGPLRLASAHRARAGGSKRMVVGRDNGSIITFDGARGEVTHEIWYAFDPDDDPDLLLPYTVHTLSLEPPAVDDRPGVP